MARIQNRRVRIALLAAIVLVGLGLRVWGITWGLHNADVSRRPHPDEWVVYWMAQWFGQDHSLNPCPHQGTACFFDWGALFPYLSYGMSWAVHPVLSVLPANTFGPRADSAFILSTLSGRVVSVLTSSLTIIAAYAAARRAFGTSAGLLAALILALCALPIQLAHFATPDSTTGLLLTTTLWLCLIAMESCAVRHFALAGIATGLAVGTEYHMVLLFVPLYVAAFLSASRGPRPYVVAAIGAVASWLVVNPYVLFELPAFLAATEHTLSIRTVHSAAQYGDRFAAYGPWWLYVVRFPLGYGVGFALTAVLLLGVARSIASRSRADLLLLAWCAPYFLLVSVVSTKFMRYSAPLLAPLAILGARGVLELAGEKSARRLAVSVAAVVAVLYTASYDAAYAALFSQQDSRATASSWLSAHAVAGSTVAFAEVPNGLINLPYFVSAAGFRPCFTDFQSWRLSGAEYTVTDDYGKEDHSLYSDQLVTRYLTRIAADPSYRAVENVHVEPSAFGVTFDIDASPHDWRYPNHVITIYRSASAAALGASPRCFLHSTRAIAAARNNAAHG